MVCMLVVFCLWSNVVYCAALQEARAQYEFDKRFFTKKKVSCLALLGHRCLLVGNEANNKLKALDIKTGYKKKIASEHEGPIHDIAPISGFDIATAGRDDTIRVWDITTGESKHVFPCAGVKLLKLVGKNVLVAIDAPTLEVQGRVRSWDVASQKPISSDLASYADVHCIEALQGNSVALGLDKGQIAIHDVKTGASRIVRDPEHLWTIVSLARLPDNILAYALKSGEVKIIDLNDSRVCFEKKINSYGKQQLISLGDEVIAAPETRMSVLDSGHSKIYPWFSFRALSASEISVNGNGIRRMLAPSSGEFFVADAQWDQMIEVLGLPIDESVTRRVHNLCIVKRSGAEISEAKIDSVFGKWVVSGKKKKQKAKKQKVWKVNNNNKWKLGYLD